jgi:hypothetical protein
MTFKTLLDYNSSQGLIVPFQAVSDAVPGFAFGVCSVVWLIIALGTYYNQQRRFGKGEIFASTSVGGFIACVSAGLMSLIPNFISTTEIIILIVIELISVVLLFIDKD